MEQKENDKALMDKPAPGHVAQRMLVTRRQRMMTAVRSMLGIDAFSFRGKVVLLTGGSRGLGLVMARRLADEGARLAIVARDAEELDRAREDLTRRGAEVIAVKCDVRERDQVLSAVEQVKQQMGPVQVLINVAGVIQVGPMQHQTHEDFEEAMRTHLWGPLHMTLAVLPDMKAARSGRIVNISSIGGKVAVPHMLPYSASKFALAGLSEGMRAELMKDGIVVTSVFPGLMRTGSIYNALFKGQHRSEFTWFAIPDSLPVSSVSADRAARIILRAVRMGRAEITVGAPAKMARVAQGLMPGLVSDMMGIVNQILPGPGGIGTRRAKGHDSQSPLTRSIVTVLSRIAARKNNEMQPEHSESGGHAEPAEHSEPGHARPAEHSETGEPGGHARRQGRGGHAKQQGRGSHAK